MEGGSALFNSNFVGGDFLWWVGQIVDDATWRDNILPGKFEDTESIPGWGRRYKVRIMGLHDKEEETIPSDQLPWANIMYPVTAGSGGANAFQTSNLRQGMFVFGFFLDGKDQQVPVIMGVLGSNAQTPMQTTIGNNASNFAATSGFSESAKGEKDPNITPPDEALVTTKPKTKQDQQETADPPPTVELDNRGLRTDKPPTKGDLATVLAAEEEALQKALDKEAAEELVRKRVEQTKARKKALVNSPVSPSQPGATKENPDAVHQLNAGDVKRETKMQEKIVLMKPDNMVESATKAIQTQLDNIIQKVNSFLESIQSYIDAVSSPMSIIQDLQKLISDAACQVAKYMKIIFDKVMEYALKIMNKAMNAVVASLPSSMRAQFSDIKEILTETCLCMYGKMTNNLCGMIEGLLGDMLNLEENEARARERAANPEPRDASTPFVPMCKAEEFIGRALATERETIDKTNNSMLNGINTFVEDIQSEMAGVSDQIGDITSLIGAISGSMTSALSFENLKLNVFGCELKPNVSVSDYYQFATGGAAQPDSQVPAVKGIDDVSNSGNTATQVEDTPYVGPSKNQPDQDIGVDLDPGDMSRPMTQEERDAALQI